MSSFGERIKNVRDYLGLSQKEFGDLVDSGFATITDWEADRHTPRPPTIRKMMEPINQRCIDMKMNPVSFQWLRTGGGEMFIKMIDKDENTYESPIDLRTKSPKIEETGGRDQKSTVDIWVYSLKKKGKDGNFLPVEKLGIPESDFNEYIIAYRNPGREMGEVIPSGSIVAINTREKEPVSGEIYLFRFHYKGREENKQYTYLIRRIQVKKGGRGLILLSDNSQLYPPLELDPEDIHDETIMGRVMLIHGRRYLYDDLRTKTG